MNKLERTLLAKQHIEDVTKRFSKEISFSKENTLVYGGPDLKPEYTKDNDNGDEVLFSLEPYDTVTTLMKHCEESAKSGQRGNRVCVLNFASYKNPGGGYLKGSFAQEEALCSESTLYPVLAKFEHTYYDWNREHLNHALYTNRALYSPEIIFKRDNKEVVTNVITCAAPNYYGAGRQGISYEENIKALTSRVKFMYDVAEDNSVDTLILGAWGCGVFRQDAYIVAELLINEAVGRSFNQVIFAVPNNNRNDNYYYFSQVLKEYNSNL